MKIRKYFTIYNIITLITPIILIGVVSVGFILVFVMKFPVEKLYVSRAQLLVNPRALVGAAGTFFSEYPDAGFYIAAWLLFCAAITAVTNITAAGFLSRRIEGSIKDLSRAAELVRRGNFSFEILGSEIEEIDDLCREFDDMRKSLAASEKRAEALNRERTLLIANISHDLKTPVTAIRGCIDGINDGVADTPERLSDYLDIIKAKTKTIDNLVSNLSVYSSLELSGLRLDFDVGELNGVIEAAAREYAPTLERNNMELVLELTDRDTTVKIDYDKMMRVLTNIIENSIKYKRPDSGLLEIKTVRENGGVYVFIRDDGIGIEPEELERVFDSFYRADEARTSKIKGNGLGLGIAKQITEKHGGKLWLKSEGKNKGATAVIYIPSYTALGERSS